MQLYLNVKKIGENIKAVQLTKIIEKALNSQMDDIFTAFLKTDARKSLGESLEIQNTGILPYIWPKGYKLNKNQSYALCEKVYEIKHIYPADVQETMNFQFCKEIKKNQCKMLIESLKGQMFYIEYQGRGRRKTLRKKCILSKITGEKFIFMFGKKLLKIRENVLHAMFVILSPELVQNPVIKKINNIYIAGVGQNLWSLSYGNIYYH